MAIKSFARGNTQYFNIFVTDDKDDPIDITGSTIYFTLKKNLTDTAPAYSNTITTHTNPTIGQSQIKLTHTDSKELTPLKYHYDFRILFANGDVDTIDSGEVTIEWNVSDIP